MFKLSLKLAALATFVFAWSPGLALAQDLPLQANFQNPAAGGQLSGSTNLIAWEYSRQELEISEQRLYYYSVVAPQVRYDLATLDALARSFTWDVSLLAAGNYRLELVAKSSGTSFIFSSPAFSIKKATSQTSTSLPTLTSAVINVLPQNDARLELRTPIISGEFLTDPGTKVLPETFELYVNNQRATDWCKLNAVGFICTPPTQLSFGVHRLQVILRDTNFKLITREWGFTILNPSQQQIEDEQPTQISTNAILLAVLLCVAVIIVVLVPWSLIIMWKRQDNLARASWDDPVDAAAPLDADLPELHGEVDPIKLSTPASSAVPSPKQTSAPALDPASFATYEDYLQAATKLVAKQNARQENPLPVKPTAPATVAIDIPDYEQFYTSTASTTPSSEKEKEKANTPDWLNPS